jgi:tetratricopeptide (TPR) repeat protein
MSTASSQPQLDNDELMHLALQANDTDDIETVIGYLKRVLANDPNHGSALYLLGAQHAQMGMFDRAVEEMTRAVEVDPNIPPAAHFQLGLLHLTSGRVAESMAAWAPLDQLEQDDALLLFKRGLIHLIKDEFADCIELLEYGITVNNLHPALNKDMQMFADKAKEVMLQNNSAATADETETIANDEIPASDISDDEPTPAQTKRADLSAYKPDTDD